MDIEAVPQRNPPPAVLLRCSYRDQGKVNKRTILDLSDGPPEPIEGFKALLRGGTAVAPTARVHDQALASPWPYRRPPRHASNDRSGSLVIGLAINARLQQVR